ncbi:MAG: hypothetical protein U1F27_03850 [Turneriella sp.]
MNRLLTYIHTLVARFMILFALGSTIPALGDDPEEAIPLEKKAEPEKIKLAKPPGESDTTAPRKQDAENPTARPDESAQTKADLKDNNTLPADGKPAMEKREDEKPLATKPVEIQAPARTEINNQPALTVGGSLAVINTSGEIHNYLDTAVGVNVFAHTGFLADVLPVAAFAQAGYFNASSYSVQSMSFFYGQLGAGVPIDLPWDLTLFPYAAAGIHTGKYTPVSSSVAASRFLLASFDLGTIVSYRLSREIGITIKGGWMPVLDEFVSSNFWHIGAGATYAL